MARSGLGSEEGFTLVEVLLAASLLVILFGLALVLMAAAQVSSISAHRTGDDREQLKVAMAMIASDLLSAEWACAADCTASRFQVSVYQPTPDLGRFNPDPAWSKWPGHLQKGARLLVIYELVDGSMIRTIADGRVPDWVYTRQVLATGFDQSRFVIDHQGQTVTVILRAGEAESRGAWHVW